MSTHAQAVIGSLGMSTHTQAVIGSLGKGWGLLTGEWRERDARRGECNRTCLARFGATSVEGDTCHFNCQMQYNDGLVYMGQKGAAFLAVAGIVGAVGIYFATRKKR